MRLTEYETTIKSKVNNDPNDPSIYEDLQKMILIFLSRKKACRSGKDYEDISYLLAGDIYLSITQGTRYNYYLGYLEKIYMRYVLQYYSENSDPEIFYTEDPLDALSLSDYTYQVEEYNMICDRVYLKDIGKLVEQVMNQSCKYDPNSLVFLNLKLSLLLSLLRREPVYYHLQPEHQFYLTMIIKNFQSKILLDMRG